MLLYDFNFYYRVKKPTKWVCSKSKCNVSLTINSKETEVVRKPADHKHLLFTQCELDVKQTKKDMRTGLLGCNKWLTGLSLIDYLIK